MSTSHQSPSQTVPYYHLPAHRTSRKPLSARFHGPTDPQRRLSQASNTFQPSTNHDLPSSSIAGPAGLEPNNQVSHQTRRLSRHPDAIAHGIAKEAAKRKAKEHKLRKKEAKKEEKKRKEWLGGVAWGFDPTAGLTSSRPSGIDGGAYVAGVEGADEMDEVGRPTGRRWQGDNQWGVEYGGPGNEGKFGHGSLRDRLGISVSGLLNPRRSS